MCKFTLTLEGYQSQTGLDNQFMFYPWQRDEYRLYSPKTPAAVDPAMLQWIQKYPLAWAETAGVGLAKQRPPIIVELKANATPVKIKQYPMSQEARQGITPHIQHLLKVGILKKCRSPWNTPLLPVKKPGETDFRPKIFVKSTNG